MDITETMINEYTATGAITCPNCKKYNAIIVTFDSISGCYDFGCRDCNYSIRQTPEQYTAYLATPKAEPLMIGATKDYCNAHGFEDCPNCPTFDSRGDDNYTEREVTLPCTECGLIEACHVSGCPNDEYATVTIKATEYAALIRNTVKLNEIERAVEMRQEQGNSRAVVTQDDGSGNQILGDGTVLR